MFLGRRVELKKLNEFRRRRTSGIVVCTGRRRIGKSTLIEEFGKGLRFLEFYGLPPRGGLTKEDQLRHFGQLMGLAFGVPPMHFTDWTEALSALAGLTQDGEVVIFLDEISWMAQGDRDFVGKLKGVWDTKFKKNPCLILVLCGSISSWIDDNILNDTSFMGRISLSLRVEEMPLHDASLFWRDAPGVSSFERLQLLSVTGGVPRYLEEIDPSQTAEQNIHRMAFSRGGFLVDEFDKIFQDIFDRKAADYRKIVEALSYGNLDVGTLCSQLQIEPTGGFSKKLRTLEAAGFISRDFVWQGKQKRGKLSRLRLRDNYLRFYLRYIAPNKERIEQDLYEFRGFQGLPEWSQVAGLQFENLVLNNLKTIFSMLQLAPNSILSAAPYFQNRTRLHRGCQVDLLIQTKYSFYLCEVKFRSKIGLEVVDEVREKMERLVTPKQVSVRPVLIYEGELTSSVQESGFFSHCLSFADLLEERHPA